MLHRRFTQLLLARSGADEPMVVSLRGRIRRDTDTSCPSFHGGERHELSMSLPWVYLRRYVLAMTLSIVALVFTLFAEPATSAQAQIAFEDFNSFAGAGFSPTPSAGQLDSDDWIVTGLSDGSMTFGDTRTSGDFARGTHAGGTNTGGIWAFEVSTGNRILGVQPGGDDFTPGSFEFRYLNTLSNTVTSMDVAYTVYQRNDQGRASTLGLHYSDGCITYTAVPSLTVTTEMTAVLPAPWVSSTITTTVSGLNIPASTGVFCVRWTGDDAGGSGGRDELGIDDVTVKPTEPTLIQLASFHAEVVDEAVRLVWRTAVEVDNAGFNLYRAAGQGSHYAQVNPALIAAQADPGQGASYAYTDQPGPGVFYYLLEDVDTAGKATRHGPVTAEIRTAGGQGAGKLFLPVISQ